MTVVLVKGDVAYEDVATLASTLHRVIRENNSEIVVDFSEVGHCDVSLNGQLVAAKREAQVKRRALVLTRLSPTVRKTIDAGHVGNQVEIYRTTEEAIAALADKAHGSEARRVIQNIECGHEDCVFFTYSTSGLSVVPSCEYAYPDEIINGPNCRCYRVNWKQFESVVPQGEIKFKPNADRSSPYKARDQYAEENPVEETFAPEPETQEVAPVEPEPDFEPMEPEFEPVESTEPTSYEEPPAEPAPTTAEAPADPFADDNFPSATGSDMVVEEPVPTPSPAPEPVPQPAPQPVPPPHSEPAVQIAPPEETRPTTPEEVVVQFVEAWNTGRFDLEYDCLSVKTRGLEQQEYSERRRTLKNAQHQKHKRATHQTVASVDLTATQEDHATVEVTRLDRTSSGPKSYGQHFSLIREEGEWKIHVVTEAEAHKTATATPPPSKDRKMKAGDFFGKSKPVSE